ncbi:hypothetical protein NIES4071_29470 [Calothrix sp. NIES-4071]|nr:hypothetical protein NIES4071_29470 [Calothrix sp. NIES-4071]BAZ57267.1 hypothetical protein NIES4105_29410 [Calothrix sp. NIES-4105]
MFALDSLNNVTTLHSADSVLQINELVIEIDPVAIRGRDATEQVLLNWYSKKYDPQGTKNKQTIIKDYITTTGGLSGMVAKISGRLNNTGLEDTTRFLLSNKQIYAYLIATALQEDKVKEDDEDALYNTVLRSVTNLPRRYFLARLVTEVVNARKLRLKEDNKQWQRLDDLTLTQGISIRFGEVEPAVMAILSTLYKEGDIPTYVESYIKRSIIPAQSFTSVVKKGMVDYLVQLGVQIKSEEEFNKGLYDDYFLLAYNESRKLKTVNDDPLDTARTKGAEISWNFTVDTFETTEAQGIIPENILAAGALDYIYYMGDSMQVFNIANALVLRWASGMLDVPDGITATNLYRFHKRRIERSTPEERAMLYKRVLNKGNGKMLSSMVANKDFPMFWHSLMSEIAQYIKKTENSRSNEQVSRSPVYQATKNLQYNLTEFMTGMAHRQVHEDYAHLQDALEIIKSEEIITRFGGRRKNLWNVIETVAKEDLETSIPTATLRTLAVEGNKVFQWIANFKEGTVKEDQFKAFLSSGEAWIIAQASMDGDDFMPSNKESSNGKAEKNGKNDDFDDWDV